MLARRTTIVINPRLEPFLRFDPLHGFGGSNLLNVIMERYYSGLINPARKALGRIFSPAELKIIYEVFRFEKWASHSGVASPAMVRAILKQGIDDAKNVQPLNRSNIIKKIINLADVEIFALSEQIQDHWYDPTARELQPDKTAPRSSLGPTGVTRSLRGRILDAMEKANGKYDTKIILEMVNADGGPHVDNAGTFCQILSRERGIKNSLNTKK